jgi:hypothetical protein
MRAANFVVMAVLALALPTPAEPPPSDAKLKQERVDLATQGYTAASAALKAGTGTADRIPVWSKRMLDAKREAGGDEAVALFEHLERMKALETAVKAQVESGMASKSALLEASYERVEAALATRRRK